jgi:hypothetical protein
MAGALAFAAQAAHSINATKQEPNRLLDQNGLGGVCMSLCSSVSRRLARKLGASKLRFLLVSRHLLKGVDHFDCFYRLRL